MAPAPLWTLSPLPHTRKDLLTAIDGRNSHEFICFRQTYMSVNLIFQIPKPISSHVNMQLLLLQTPKHRGRLCRVTLSHINPALLCCVGRDLAESDRPHFFGTTKSLLLAAQCPVDSNNRRLLILSTVQTKDDLHHQELNQWSSPHSC